MTTSLRSAFRSAIRALRRRPGFFAIAVGSLGIALGLSTAVFAMIDALRHPLASNDGAERVFRVSSTGGFESGRWFVGGVQELEQTLESLPGFEDVAGHTWMRLEIDAGGRTAFRVAHEVVPNYARVLGLRVARGRLFVDDDHTRRDVAVVSDDVWRIHFNNRKNLDGATIRVGDRLLTVVGVLAPHMQAADVLIPTTQASLNSRRIGGFSGWYSLVGRLKPGWTTERMQPFFTQVETGFLAQYGSWRVPYKLILASIRPVPEQFRQSHFAMIGAAIGILLIACANVAALMLARGVSNRRDYALHLALGAKPIDLTRGVVAEVTVIGVCGAIVGVIIAVWATQILTVSVPENLNNLGLATPQWSGRVFALAFVAMLCAVALAAAGPAWFAARTNPQEPLKDAAGTTTGRASTRFRLLVVTEMAVSMTLLMGASLMAKSVRELANPDLGYDPHTLFQASVSFPSTGDATTLVHGDAAARTALDRVRAIDGVTTAAFYSLRQPDSLAIVTELTASGGTQLLYTEDDSYIATGPGFLATIGIPLIAGRDFVEGDRARGAVILSRRAQRVLFPRGDALGRLVKLGDALSQQPWLPVVGVVRDVELRPRDETSTREPIPPVYAFFGDSNPRAVSIIARARSETETVAARASYILNDLAPAGSRVRVSTWNSMFGQLLRSARYVGRLFVMLGVASLVLAAAGLFSVLSYVVSQRTREFAVRIALGARRPNIARLVVGDAMVMALGGTAIGAGVGMWTGFFIWDLLYQVYPVDAEALVIAEATLLLATLAACALPAIRATRANPLDVIRAT